MSIAARGLYERNSSHLPPIRRPSTGSTSPGDRQKGQKPTMLVCYLCGQQFGTASLEIHQMQCYVKKTIEWERGEPGRRGPRPKDPAKVDKSAKLLTRDEFNDQQFSNFTENLCPCPNCGRKFLADRLEVHLRSCKAGSAGASKPVRGRDASPAGGGGGGGGGYSSSSPSSGSSNNNRAQSASSGGANNRNKGQKPTFLVCYLCGQQFGTSSLTIHMPQCYDKKMAQWQVADPSTRGPRPKDPATVDISAMPKNRDEFNDQQFSNFSENLSPCPNCGRKFLPDRLEVHLRSCKAGSSGASRPVKGKEYSPPSSSSGSGGGGGGIGGGSSSSSGGSGGGDHNRPKGLKPTMLVCYLCGQQFGTASLEIHQTQCYVKQMIKWERGDPATRGPRPKDPATVDKSAMVAQNRDEFNDQQFSNFTENLSPCPNCGRKFLADRLEVHLRSCKAGSAGASKPVSSHASARAGAGGAGGGGASSGLPPRASTPSTTTPPSTNASKKSGNKGALPVSSLPAKLRALRQLLVDDIAGQAPGTPVNFKQLAQMLRQIDGSIDEGDVALIMDSLDENRDGVVDQHEWEHAVSDSPKTKTSSKPPPQTQNVFCDGCGTSILKSHRFCPSCGCEQEEEEGGDGDDYENNENGEEDYDDDDESQQQAAAVMGMLCNTCGEVFTSDAKFCEECGEDLTPLMANGQHQHQQHHGEDARGVNQTPTPPSTANPQSPSRKSMQERRNNNAMSTASAARSSTGDDNEAPPARSYDFDAAARASLNDETDEERVPCSVCGRQFNMSTIMRHEQICSKLKAKPRRVFDSKRHRVQGTDLAGFKPTSTTTTTSSYQTTNTSASSARGGGGGAKPKWKSQSDEFRNAMKQARQVTQVLAKGGNVKDLPPPTYSENSHYKQCPHCARRFAPDVADRHIPKCAQTMNRPKPPPRRR